MKRTEMEKRMYICDACQAEPGIYHATLTVQVVGPGGTKSKMVQFWLCQRCEMANRQVMERRPALLSTIAQRLTQWPEHVSRWKDWRKRVHPDYQEAQP